MSLIAGRLLHSSTTLPIGWNSKIDWRSSRAATEPPPVNAFTALVASLAPRGGSPVAISRVSPESRATSGEASPPRLTPASRNISMPAEQA